MNAEENASFHVIFSHPNFIVISHSDIIAVLDYSWRMWSVGSQNYTRIAVAAIFFKLASFRTYINVLFCLQFSGWLVKILERM